MSTDKMREALLNMQGLFLTPAVRLAMGKQWTAMHSEVAKQVNDLLGPIANGSTAEISYGHEYKGYKYCPGVLEEDDVTKIWHEIQRPNGCPVMLSHSPYSHPTEAQFCAAVDKLLTMTEEEIEAMRQYGVVVMRA